jgi:hypothetical protein
MEEEGDSTVITLDMEFGSWGCQRYHVPTASGPISVVVCGDQDKPALLTYPDVGLNYVSCFEGLFSYPEASSVLYHNFCIYHVDVLGHEVSILLYLVVVATVRYQILRKGWQCPKNAVTYHDLKVYVTQ